MWAGSAVLGRVTAQRGDAFAVENAGFRHFQLRRHPAADPGGGVEGVQRVVIFLHAGQVLRHGAVDAPVHGGHHAADDIWFLHGDPP